jgi:hypothetical protein
VYGKHQTRGLSRLQDSDSCFNLSAIPRAWRTST